MTLDNMSDSSPNITEEIINDSCPNLREESVSNNSPNIQDININDVIPNLSSGDSSEVSVNIDNVNISEMRSETIIEDKKPRDKCTCRNAELSFFGKSFWDLWLQKMFRNFASVKFQFMVAFFWLIVYGMFVAKDSQGEPFISAVAGLAFLGGGFISLVTSRLAIRTSLFDQASEDGFDTDR
jgi:hypothetical protein